MSPSRLTTEVWPVTHPGQAPENEDTVLVYQPPDPQRVRLDGSLYIVADGMGGAQRGKVASYYAAARVMHAYYNSQEPDLGLRLREAVEIANAELYAYAQRRPELVKLGTTIVAAVIRGEQMHVASVGDSRAYVIREGEIHQITRDHTLVQQLIDEGAITPEEARNHPRRSVVLRLLGAAETVEVDVIDFRLRPDDAVVLCSDGLTTQLDSSEIAGIVWTSSPRAAAETLVQKAYDRGSKDNISVVTALLRDGAPAIQVETPHTWDGSLPSFEQMPALVTRPAAPEAPPPAPVGPPPAVEDQGWATAGDETVPTRPAIEDQGWAAAGAETLHAAPTPPPPGVVSAPGFEGSVQPAPSYGAPAGTPPPQPAPAPPQYGPAQPRGYQPPPGYEFDPVTGLPPTPVAGPTGPQMPPARRPVAQPTRPTQLAERPRRGVPLGLFLMVALLTVLLVIAMVFILVNPFGWQLPQVAGLLGGEEPTATPTTAPPSPTPEVVEPTPTTPSTPEPTPLPQAPPGMVLVDQGSFRRGAEQDEIDQAVLRCIQLAEDNTLCYPEYFSDATPVLEIVLSAFYIDAFEVTNLDYAECVAAEVCTPPSNDTFYADPAFAQHPVTYVTYDQAQDYCEWRGGRLPTEAEWEKAARYDPLSGESYWFPWGYDYEEGRANTASAGLGGTAAVGSFPGDLSPLGLYDMAGNVSEWVLDWYFPNYEGFGTLNPTGPDTQPLPQPFRVARGGNFERIEPFARAAQRLDVPPQSSVPWLGFRCVIEVPGAAAPAGETPAAAETPAGEATPAAEETTTPAP